MAASQAAHGGSIPLTRCFPYEMMPLFRVES
jgi:hypothetical protein